MKNIPVFGVGDTVELKKAHPCGGVAWTVKRVGADIKLQCNTCNRFVNLTRDELKKRAKRVEKAEE